MTSVLPSPDVFFKLFLFVRWQCPVQKALADMGYSLL